MPKGNPIDFGMAKKNANKKYFRIYISRDTSIKPVKVVINRKFKFQI